MAGEIISVVAQASTTSSWVDAPVLSSVSESDAARLSDLLSTQQVQAPAPAQTPPVSSTSPIDSKGNSLGDAILRSMDSAGRSYKQKAGEIDKLMNLGPEMTPTELVRLQFQLIDSSMQVDLISKAISKANQHIDQMTKLQ